MPRREPSDPSAALARVQAGFTGGATGILESLKQRREGGQRIQELLLAGRLRREEQAADPEFQAKQAALQAIEELTPFPQALSSANAPPEKRNRLQELFRGRMTERLGERAKLSEMFGLVPRRQPTAAETIAELQTILGSTTQKDQGTPFQPTAVTRGGVRFEAAPEIKAEREALTEGLKKEFDRANRLAGTIRQLSTITGQFMEALPTGQRSAIEQRFAGVAARIGARTGLDPNPQLLALLTNSRLEAIQLIRSFGEVGNLSQSEQQAAIAAYDQSGQTDEERLAKIQQLATFASASISPRARQLLLRENPDLGELMAGLGIDITNLGKPTRPSFLSGKGMVRKTEFRVVGEVR